jgi:hypothetical protein
MTQDKLKTLIEDLHLNHEYCPKEVILQAADELKRLAQRTWVGLAKEDRLCAKYMQDAPEGIEAVIDYIESKLKELNT